MNEIQQPVPGNRDGRKTYQTLKLVEHGHFRDVVKNPDSADGSQIRDNVLDIDPS